MNDLQVLIDLIHKGDIAAQSGCQSAVIGKDCWEIESRVFSFAQGTSGWSSADILMSALQGYIDQYGSNLVGYYWQVLLDNKYYKAQLIYALNSKVPVFLVFDEDHGYQLVNKTSHNLTQFDLIILYTNPGE